MGKGWRSWLMRLLPRSPEPSRASASASPTAASPRSSPPSGRTQRLLSRIIMPSKPMGFIVSPQRSTSCLRPLSSVTK